MFFYANKFKTIIKFKMMNLKYFFRILILLIFINGAAYAQDFNKTLDKVGIEKREQKQFGLFKRVVADSTLSKWEYGVQLGANVSSVKGDAEGTAGQVGYSVGGFFRYNINTELSLQAELNYSREGARQDTDTLLTGVLLDSGLTAASRYNYINIPISLRYYPITDNGFFVTGGAFANYLIHAELQGTGGEFSLTSDDRIDIANRLNKLDFGFNIGAGYTWAKMLDVTVRWKQGFANTVDNNHERTASTGSYINKSIQVILGFKF